MVVEGRHAEEPLAAGLFEVYDLDNIGQNLQDVDESHNRDHQRQVQGEGQAAHRAPQEQGAGVPHEHLGRMEVIDEEGRQSPRQGGGHDDQVGAAIPGGHRHIANHHRDGHSGGQTVHPVGEVDGVHRPHHDEGGEDHVYDPGDAHDLHI